MEQEQIIKRLEWLDDERRKDKLLIASLEDRFNTMEESVTGLMQQVKELGSEATRISATLARVDQLDSALAQTRVEILRTIEGVEKQRGDREREMDKVRLDDLESTNKSLAELRKGHDLVLEIKKGMQLRVEEEFRLGRMIDELEKKLGEIEHTNEEIRRTQRMQDEGRRQDSKRVGDLQSEVSTLRKRQDEQRGKMDVASETMRKLELRMSELQVAEAERRQAMTAFFDKQNLVQVDRDRTWKEYEARFEAISKQSMNLDAQLQALDALNRSVKRSQEAFDDVNQRFDRRVNEITEMQRLMEERFRQEWVTFKADDQKRWTNYTLSQEELQREAGRHLEKHGERLVALDELAQELHDLIFQNAEENLKRVHIIREMLDQWTKDYDRHYGRAR